MNDTLTTIYDRRAVRKYEDKTVDRNLIEQIIDAGRMAPSALNKQPWNFHVVTNHETIRLFSKEIAKIAAKEIAHMKAQKLLKLAASFFYLAHGLDFLKLKDAIFHGAPVVIFITSPKIDEWAALDVGMCAQNMMLAAKSLGLESCPVGFAKYIEKAECYLRLQVPETEQVNLAVVIGYGNENPNVTDRNKKNVFYIE